MRLATALPLVAASTAFAWLLDYDLVTIQVVAILALFAAVNLMAGIFLALCQAFEALKYGAVGRTVESFARLFGAVLILRSANSPTAVALVYVLAGFVLLMTLTWLFIRRFGSAGIRFRPHQWRNLLSKSRPFWAIGVLALLTGRVGPLILSVLAGPLAIGLFMAAFKLRDVLGSIPIAITSSALPVFVKHRFAAQNLRRTFEATSLLLLAVALPMVVGGPLISGPLMVGLFGDAYAEAGPALAIVLGYVFLSFLNWTPGIMLAATGHEGTVLRFTAFVLIVNTVTAAVLIPAFGYLGAAATVVFGELVLLVLQWGYVYRRMFRPSLGFWSRALRLVVTTGITVAPITFAIRGYSPWAVIPVVALAYTLALRAVYGPYRTLLAIPS